MNPEIVITKKYTTTDYRVVRYLCNDFCVVRLNKPFPKINSFPERGLEGKFEFLTKLNVKDYRELKIKQILNADT